MNLVEEKIDGEYRFRGRVINLRVDRVRLPNGRVAEREVVEHPGAAAVVAVDSGRVLLLRQFRYAPGKTLVEIPAGKLQRGEDPLECARRELEEETGFRAASLEKLAEVHTSPGFCDEVMHLYLASDLQETGDSPDDDEFLEVFWKDLREAVEGCLKENNYDGKTTAGLLLAARRLGL